MNRTLPWLLLLLLSGCFALRSVTLESDPRTDALLMEGKQALRNEDYMTAWDAFEMAREREFNRSTTAATYLAGLAAYHLGYDDIAQTRFLAIIREYPRSRYLEDAQYHLALVTLRQPGRPQATFEALGALLSLQQTARDPGIKPLAMAAWKQYLFDKADRDMLDVYTSSAPDRYQAQVMEALIYKILQEDGPVVARHRLSSYREQGGEMTDWLKKLMPVSGSGGAVQPVVTVDPRWKDPSTIRVALVLPFQLDQIPYPAGLNEIPGQMTRPLEFYEGFRMAVEEFQAQSSKRVYVNVIDSRRDTFLVRRLFKKLDSLGVQAVVGDVYNPQSRVLSDWAETRRVPQLVPFSPTGELVQERSHTFLANPTASTHGARMAEYAFDRMGLRRMFVFSDGSEATRELMQGFKATFQSRGGRVDSLLFSPDYAGSAVKQIPALVRSIPANSPNTGIYLPIMGNEEASSLILNILQQQGKKFPVLGSPHFWSNYPTISAETKAAFNLIFTTSYYLNPDDPAYQQFYQRYLRQYSFPPSEDVVQGYDTGKYLLRQLAAYSPSLGMDLSTFLRVSPVVAGLHLPYQFRSAQSNQRVNLGKYTDDGVIRLE